MRLRFITLILLAIGATLRPAHADIEAVLIDRDLRPHPVRVQGLDDQTVTWFDEQRQFRSGGLDRFVQLRTHALPIEQVETTPAPPVPPTPPTPEEGESEPEPPLAWLVLVDGQRFPGRLQAAADDVSADLVWVHPTFGTLRLPLEQVAAIHLDGNRQPTRSEVSGTDHLTLANGDLVSGFVGRISPAGVSVTPEGAAAAVTLPLDRITRITLANPSQPATGHQCHLVDGTRLAAQTIRLGQESVDLGDTVFNDAQTVPVSPDQVLRIDFKHADLRIVSLTDLPMTVVEPSVVFGVAHPPRMTQNAVYLHAPAKVRFDLPPGTRTLALTAELVDLSGSAGGTVSRGTGGTGGAAWADCVLRIQIDDREPSVTRLHRGQRSADLNLPLDARTLTVQLDPGINGPVMDRVRLRDPVMLVNVVK